MLTLQTLRWQPISIVSDGPLRFDEGVHDRGAGLPDSFPAPTPTGM